MQINVTILSNNKLVNPCYGFYKTEQPVRVILKANYETSSSFLIETLIWDKLAVRRRKQIAIMMFKSLTRQWSRYIVPVTHSFLAPLLRCLTKVSWNQPVVSVRGRRAESADWSCCWLLAVDLLCSFLSNNCWMRHSCLSRSGKWNSVPDFWQILAKSKKK